MLMLGRIKCEPNPEDPNNPYLRCLTCQNVSMESKKRYHPLYCIRTVVLASLVLYRKGGLNLTRRFSESKVVDVVGYPDKKIRMVQVALDICSAPLTLKVRRFIPMEGDVLTRTYMNNGVETHEKLEPFCLANIEETAEEFKKYIRDRSMNGLKIASGSCDDLVRLTYSKIAERCQALPVRFSHVRNSRLYRSWLCCSYFKFETDWEQFGRMRSRCKKVGEARNSAKSRSLLTRSISGLQCVSLMKPVPSSLR